MNDNTSIILLAALIIVLGLTALIINDASCDKLDKIETNLELKK